MNYFTWKLELVQTFSWNFSNWNGVNVQWKSHSNITEEIFMWLAGAEEKYELVSDKGFFKQFLSEE